jgi:hypothetical protein
MAHSIHAYTVEPDLVVVEQRAELEQEHAALILSIAPTGIIHTVA